MEDGVVFPNRTAPSAPPTRRRQSRDPHTTHGRSRPGRNGGSGAQRQRHGAAQAKGQGKGKSGYPLTSHVSPSFLCVMNMRLLITWAGFESTCWSGVRPLAMLVTPSRAPASVTVVAR